MFVTTIEAFREDRYAAPVATRNILCWYARRDLRIVSAWGVVGPREVALVTSALSDELQEGFEPLNSLVDLTEISRLDPQSFASFFALMRDNAEAFARVILRSTYIHGGGNQLATSAVSGYTELIGKPFPTRTFGALADGFEWLGFADSAAAIIAELGELKSAVRVRFEILEPLRKAIIENLDAARAAEIAKTLGLSTRTLQRELEAIGTTLTAEVRRVRIELAQELLIETSHSIGEIASKSGFQTTRAFREAFRREIGQPPGVWRTAVREP